MKKNIRRILICVTILGVITSGMISCSSSEEKVENKKTEANESDQQIIDRIVKGSKEYANDYDAEFLEKYKASFKIKSKDYENPDSKLIQLELNDNDGVIITKGNIKILERTDDISILKRNEGDFHIVSTINPDVTKEDIQKNIVSFWDYIQLELIKNEENTIIEVQDFYVKTMNDGKLRLTVDYSYTHKDNYVNASGTGEFWLEDGAMNGTEITGGSTKSKDDTYEMFPPSIDEVKKGIPDKLSFTRQRGTIVEEVYYMSDKEADSLVINEIKQSIGYGNQVGKFDVVATFQKGEETKNVTGEVSVSVRDGKYVLFVSPTFAEQI